MTEALDSSWVDTHKFDGDTCIRCGYVADAPAEHLEPTTCDEQLRLRGPVLPKLKKPKRTKLLDRFGNPFSDSFCTPKPIADRLPLVDVDPCSNPRSHIRSRRTFSLEKKLDGLKLAWIGSAFINWPYSDPLPWAVKTTSELALGRCTEAIILCKLDTSTESWREISRLVIDVLDMWILDKRVQYDEPPELVAERIRIFKEEKGKVRSARAKYEPGEKSSNNFCSVILHHRRASALPLESLADIASRWGRV